MPLQIADRVRETTTTTGTGALTLAGAATGFAAFSSVCAVGDTCYYALQAVDGSGNPTGAWEVGIGTYSATNTLTRTTVLASSNAGAAVSLAAGTKQIWLDYPTRALKTSVPTPKGSALNNFKPSNTLTLQAIMARGASPISKARGRIVMVGDSYLAGYAAGNGDNMINGRKNNATTQVATMLANRGFRSNANWTVGDAWVSGSGGGATAPLVTYDPRLAFNNASMLGGFNSLGGNMINIATGGTMTFTPVDPVTGAAVTFDTVELIVASSVANGGTFSVKGFNGATLVTTSATQTNNDINGPKKITITVGATCNKVVVTAITNACFVQAIGVRMSTALGVEFINASASGQTVETLATPTTTNIDDPNTWNNLKSSGVLLDTNALNCTVLNGWFNDEGGSTIAATQANLNTLIQFYKTKGDVLYIGYAPLVVAAMGMSQATYVQWQSAMFATCLANDIPYIDPPAAFPVADTMNTFGYYGDSGLHLGSDGQAVIARLMLQAFDSVM
jgi:hypothetical protein